jgi:hypothetical protein
VIGRQNRGRPVAPRGGGARNFHRRRATHVVRVHAFSFRFLVCLLCVVVFVFLWFSVRHVLMYTKQLLSQLTLPDFNQLQRNSTSSAISERTLEECWTTLQRVSWILFNRVEYSSKEAIFLFRFHPGTLRRTDGRTPVRNGNCDRFETRIPPDLMLFK